MALPEVGHLLHPTVKIHRQVEEVLELYVTVEAAAVGRRSWRAV